MAYPFAILSELRDAANEHGYRIGPEQAAGWIFFRSAAAPGEIGLAAAGKNGPFFLSVTHPGVARSLEAQRVWPAAKGHAGAFIFSARDDLHMAVATTYRLSMSLPNFPYERFQAAVASLGKTEGEATQKYRIGQDIFREALMDYWNKSCPLTGISNGHLLKASHIIPWSRCETDAQRLDIYNGLLLSVLWDAAFDKGLVTFDDVGRPLLSSFLGEAEIRALSEPSVAKINISVDHQFFLQYHRDHIWIS